MDALLHVLDLGDRLIEALDADDLGAATETLREREALIAALLDGPAPAPPALLTRTRAQGARLGVALHAAQTRLHGSAAAVRRAAAASVRYGPAPPEAVLDTAPRTG